MIYNNHSPIVAKIAGCCEDLKTPLDHILNTTKSYSLFLRTKTYLLNKLQINSSLMYIFKLLIVIKHKKHKKLRRNCRGTEVWREYAQYDVNMRNMI